MTSLLIKMDVIRCSVNAGLNFRGTKLSRMAVEPRKPRKFSTAKIKVQTAIFVICVLSVCVYVLCVRTCVMCLQVHSKLQDLQCKQYCTYACSI